MNKKEVKYIKQIADRLPVVYQQIVSGYYEDYGSGEAKMFPNIVNVEINHVRRMRKAYQSLGMEGIKSYLEMIHKLQIKRNEKAQRAMDDQKQELQVDYNVQDSADQSLPVESSDQDTSENNKGVLE